VAKDSIREKIRENPHDNFKVSIYTILAVCLLSELFIQGEID